MIKSHDIHSLYVSRREAVNEGKPWEICEAELKPMPLSLGSCGLVYSVGWIEQFSRLLWSHFGSLTSIAFWTCSKLHFVHPHLCFGLMWLVILILQVIPFQTFTCQFSYTIFVSLIVM